MRAIQPHSHALGGHGDQFGQAELYHSRRVPLGQVQIPSNSCDKHLSPPHVRKTTDERRRNRYYRTDRGDENSTSVRSSNPVLKKQIPSHWANKTRDEILCELFLEKNIDLRCSRKLGCGRYSKVITGNFVSNGHAVAIKMINTQKVTEEFRSKFLPREIECWKRLNHPHLVRILGHYEAMQHVFLTMEFGRGGDMLQHVQKKGPVKEHQAMIWMSQVISAVYYMHTRGIVHRDLKLENIVIFPDEGIIKISDFGFARSVIRGDALSETYCGSKSYSAPEILKGEPYDPYKSDVWSVGVIAFVIVTDCMPYCEKRPNPQIVEAQRLRAYEYPPKLHLSDECRFSIDTMMTFSWRDRPNISHCSCLPWFQTLLPRSSHTMKPPFPLVV
ncbi:kinase domain protein [Dictyocaulus viviparus]|uniref:Kinase domain protein n=1 Tax=Dictyocaulus viviparus TaxID=29172 RepID=A0A0D8XUG8_DICVI|nr:kinase domain protein [Dictyocaulus viviparus]